MTGPNRHSVRWSVAVVAIAALALSACSSSKKPSASSSTTLAGVKPATAGAAKPVTGGVVKWAEQPNMGPTYIFPLVAPGQISIGNTEDFSQLMYRPLYWFGTGGSPTVDFARSIGRRPVFSDGDKVLTVTLNDYRWSDGERVDARDVLFWMNLLEAEKDNFGFYAPGYFPDNVKSTSMPDGPTGDKVRFQLTKSVNPTWFLYNELSQVTPLPIAWDRTSVAAPAPKPTQAGLPDTTPAGAKAVYKFLDAQSKDLRTYATSPVWAVVDGPWKLEAFTLNGEATFVPNTRYVGPDHPRLAKFIEVPYTSDTAEFNSVRANTLQVGYVPAQDASDLSTVESLGYRALKFYAFGFNYLQINFESSAAKAFFAQLYIRQALQELTDQLGWIRAFYHGLAAPSYGPVPIQPSNSFADQVERANPYPFSPSAAAKLLSEHGWTVKKGGTTTCAVPAKCGPGIRKGEPLSFTLDVTTGSVPVIDSMEDFKSEAATIGVRIAIFQRSDAGSLAEPGSTSWEIINYGAGDGWVYGPDYYATGEELFAANGGENLGSYRSRTADSLIAATTSVGQSGSQRALDAYQNYIAKQLPVLFQPAPATEFVVSKHLGGLVLKPNSFENIDPESWYYVKR